jgi:hypothetical protein
MKRALFNLILPSPHTRYLIFGYLGNPFFAPPLVVAYAFFFCLIALKKRIAKERFYLIAVDLIEWQSTIWRNENDMRPHRVFTIFQCFLERILISHVADEIISLIDRDFLTKNYRVKKIHDLEFVDHGMISRASEKSSSNQPRKLKILYAGDVGYGLGFDIDLFEDLMKSLNDSSTMLLVTYEDERSRVVERKFRAFSNFVFLGQLEAEELDKLAQDCQFGLVLYSPKYVYYNIVSPTKLGFYIANGLTVISTNLTRTRKLDEKYDFGYVLEKEEMLELVKSLSAEKIKRNTALENQIVNGCFLRKALANAILPEMGKQE